MVCERAALSHAIFLYSTLACTYNSDNKFICRQNVPQRKRLLAFGLVLAFLFFFFFAVFLKINLL